MNAATVTVRLLSALLAVLLVVGGLLVAVEIVLAQLGRPALLIPWLAWAVWLGGQTWATSIVRLLLAGLVVVGLVLLILALRPGKPRRLALPAIDRAVHVSIARRALQQTLKDAAARATGVASASAKAGRRTVTITATTANPNTTEVHHAALAAVNQRLEQLGLAGRLRPRVRIEGSS
jgi:glucose dehydrogenase